MTAIVIVNPRSAGGKTGDRLGELRRLVYARLGNDAVVQLTTYSGHASVLAEAAARQGASTVVAVGGDGTASEVVHGLMTAWDDGVAPPSFGVLTAGTGSDTVRTLGMPTDWDAALEVIATTEARPTDVIEGRFTGADGVEVRRWGFNEVSFGLSGEVVDRVNASSKRLGGFLTFLGATVITALTYKAPTVRITWSPVEGEDATWEGPLTVGFVGNGRYSGGGMRTGGDARMDDGALNLVMAPDVPLLKTLQRMPRLYDGKLADVDGLIVAKVRAIRAELMDGAPLKADLDGEMPGLAPLSAHVVPGVLPVHGTWPEP